MKKFISILLVVAMIALCAISVFAAWPDQEKRDELLTLLKEYKIETKDGTILVFADADINAAKNYLSSYDGTVDQEKIDYVKAKLDACAAVVINSGASIKVMSDIKKLPVADKEAIINYTNQALAFFDLEAAYNPTTNKVDYKDIDTGELVYESAAVLKKSGDSVNVAPIAIVSVAVAIAVIGCAIVVKKYALAK